MKSVEYEVLILNVAIQNFITKVAATYIVPYPYLLKCSRDYFIKEFIENSLLLIVEMGQSFVRITLIFIYLKKAWHWWREKL